MFSLRPATVVRILFLLVCVAVPSIQAQNSSLPFELSNPKNKKWEAPEAVRIYTWACDLLARTIRPEKPPQLHPNFRLVLGTEADEFVHENNIFEIHLKSWDPEKFSRGVVLIAMSGVVQTDELNRLAHQSVSLANSTLDARHISH